eukprot:UN12292
MPKTHSVGMPPGLWPQTSAMVFMTSKCWVDFNQDTFHMAGTSSSHLDVISWSGHLRHQVRPSQGILLLVLFSAKAKMVRRTRLNCIKLANE